jgi:hypothetical protein
MYTFYYDAMYYVMYDPQPTFVFTDGSFLNVIQCDGNM